MRRPCMLFTVRQMMIMVALVGLNLAGAIATSKYYPRPPYLSVGYGNGRGFIYYKADGTILQGSGNAETGYRLTRVIRRPPRPSLLQIWSPVLASVAITLGVLVVAVRYVASASREVRDTSTAPTLGLSEVR
ncbi:MAG: hypothetical protein IRY99_18485 [Isosphaeraceae bacterium]|nr:hypothetical protein [Isosphaeraceae bacterium]